MSYMSIDPAQLAQQYTSIDRAAKDQVLNTQRSRFNGQLTAIKSLQTSLKSYTDQVTTFNKDQSLFSNSAKSSADTTVSITATAKAAAGEYEIFVDKLAQSHQLALSFDPDAALPADGVFSLTIGDKTVSVDLSSLPANAKLADLSRAINNHADNPGVNATLVRSGSETFLMLSSEETGAANQISLSFTAGADSNGSIISDAITNKKELKAAQDAQVRLGADSTITITSASNKLENVIEGVTLNLLKAQATDDNPVKVSIAQDMTAAKANIDKLISGFNGLVTSITGNDSLKNDSMARGIHNQLRNAFQGDVNGKSFYSIGLEFDRFGKLSVNKERFEKALAEDPAAVEAMFNGEGGLLARIETNITPYTKSQGIISEKQKTVQASLDMVTEKQKRHDAAMEQKLKRYQLQFTQMQMTIAQLESSMSQFGS